MLAGLSEVFDDSQRQLKEVADTIKKTKEMKENADPAPEVTPEEVANEAEAEGEEPDEAEAEEPDNGEEPDDAEEPDNAEEPDDAEEAEEPETSDDANAQAADVVEDPSANTVTNNATGGIEEAATSDAIDSETTQESSHSEKTAHPVSNASTEEVSTGGNTQKATEKKTESEHSSVQSSQGVSVSSTANTTSPGADAETQTVGKGPGKSTKKADHPSTDPKSVTQGSAAPATALHKQTTNATTIKAQTAVATPAKATAANDVNNTGKKTTKKTVVDTAKEKSGQRGASAL